MEETDEMDEMDEMDEVDEMDRVDEMDGVDCTASKLAVGTAFDDCGGKGGRIGEEF